MLDDLRNSASRSFQEEEEPQPPPQKPREVIRIRQNPNQQPFLGMTPEQRFMLALLLFMMVSVMGVLLLIVTDKVFIF